MSFSLGRLGRKSRTVKYLYVPMSSNVTEALESRDNQILLAARMVREHYYPKRRKNLPDWILVLAVRDMLDMLPNASPEELFEYLIAQPRIKAHMSRYMAASLVAEATAERTNKDSAEVSVYTGARKFSFEKIAAMTAYITSNGQKTSRIKLDKLLFYCDFVSYFLHGHSISGAKYVRHSQGPEIDQYESILKTLRFSGVIKIENESDIGENIVAHDQTMVGNLSIVETITMYWVLTNIGAMSSAEISRYSNNESAYRFTRQGEYIAYEYAGLLQKLPARSMFKRHAAGRRS